MQNLQMLEESLILADRVVALKTIWRATERLHDKLIDNRKIWSNIGLCMHICSIQRSTKNDKIFYFSHPKIALFLYAIFNSNS